MQAQGKRGFRFGALVGVGGSLLIVLGFGVYARSCVDYGALAEAHDERVLQAAFDNRIDLDALGASLVRFHQGPPPCFSHARAKDPPDAELAEIERDLRGSKMLARVRDLSAIFWQWGQADEDRRHGAITDEEIITGWDETGTGYDHAIATFAGHALAVTIREKNRVASDQMNGRADELRKSLSEHELESLYGIWVRHPVAMSFPGFVRTMTRLPRE